MAVFGIFRRSTEGSGPVPGRSRRAWAAAAVGATSTMVLGPLAFLLGPSVATASPPSALVDVPELGPEGPASPPVSADAYRGAPSFDGVNHLVVWSESNEYSEVQIAGARVAPDGTPIDPLGISISQGQHDYWPAVAFGGQGHLVVFERRAGEYDDDDIYGIRVGVDGSAQGSAFLIAGGPTFQGGAKVVFDGTNYLVGWTDARLGDGLSSGAVVARVTPTGTVLDPVGIPVSPADGSSLHGIAHDGTNALVVWGHTGTGRSGPIRAARVALDGTVLDPSGIAVSGSGYEASVTVVGPNFMIAWEQVRADLEGSDIYASRISPAGVPLDGQGLVVDDSPGWQYSASIAFDGTNALVAWREDGGNLDVYGARVAVNGTVPDPGRFPLVVGEDEQLDPVLSAGGADLLLLWHSFSTGVRALGLIDGEPVPTGDGQIVTRKGAAETPDVAFDGTNSLVVWEDKGRPFEVGRSIYASRLGPSGELLDRTAIVVATTSMSFEADGPSVSFDGTNYLVVWTDTRRNGFNIYGARVSPSGVLLDPDGIVISPADGMQTDPEVTFDGTNHLVVWEDHRAGDADIWGSRVSPAGAVLDEVPVARAPGAQTAPEVASGGGSSLIVWADTRTGEADINSIRLSGDGRLIGPDGEQVHSTGPGVPVSSAGGEQLQPAVSWNGGRYLVVWADRRGGATADIYASRVTYANGVEDPNGLIISAAPDDQSAPATDANAGIFLVAWADRRSGTGLDTYGARVDDAGALLDGAGFAIADGPLPESQPAVSNGVGADLNVVWSRNRLTNPDNEGAMYLRTVSPK